VQSTALLQRLAAERVVCDICPVSNVRLGVVPDEASHPGPVMHAAGVPVTLNADDSLWFGRSVTDQYVLAREAWGWSDETLADVARVGALLPALTDQTRNRLLSSVEEWLATSGMEGQG
jgi:adenosine deaminase